MTSSARQSIQPPDPRRSGAARRVLVVDDNPASAETLAELLELLGHTVEVARDGPSALAKARANPPDVVICDIGLPGMSGYEVARALRAERIGARLVALSGHSQPADVRAATAAGFDEYLVKPADLDRIEQLLA